MYANIQKWGNSHAVRLPKAILEPLRLRENDALEIFTDKNQIILRPTKRKRISLEELLADWDGEIPEAYDWGELDAPVGRELL